MHESLNARGLETNEVKHKNLSKLALGLYLQCYPGNYHLPTLSKSVVVRNLADTSYHKSEFFLSKAQENMTKRFLTVKS